jgi:hypothetical protein
MRISDLILKADGLRKTPITRERIIRKNQTTEIVTVDLEQALSGNLESDIALYKKMW